MLEFTNLGGEFPNFRTSILRMAFVAEWPLAGMAASWE